ncbi:class I SAM-dependent methyltransferase [Nitratireductor luteus]|uniref:class I SAM-dependent methyltransferase n=1 Tax=Nitratireductor luteus TaxID=2976980 RepID=UPI00223EBFE5|nr:class I SAM-dependent methyltransferase [Nitratireductor luteus]
MNETLRTLLFPFERGVLDTPADGRSLALGPDAGFRLPGEFGGTLALVQGFRPDHLALANAGFEVTAEATGENYDNALVFLGRHRRENEARLMEALMRVRPGGLIVAAGTKKDGAGSFRKRIETLLPITDHASKYHGVVFWLTRPDAIAEEIVAALQPQSPAADGFQTALGGFSDDGIDRGSQLLADNLPGDIKGHVADFGAGWGYLSVAVAKLCSVTQIDLYEAHHGSLEAARHNMARMAAGMPCRLFWRDLASEPTEMRYDAIVMNPPFHTGRAAEPDIGKTLIAKAAKALKPGGRLFLVANRPLPYEGAMEACFSRHGEICRDSAFKVLWGKR